jgi:kumamolisin
MKRHGKSPPTTGQRLRRDRRAALHEFGGRPSVQDPLVLTLYLREPNKPRRRPGSAAPIAELSTRVSREQLKEERKRQFQSPIAKIRRYAKQCGIRIFDVDPTRRRVRLRATSTKSEKAFTTRLREIEHGGCHYRCPDRTPRVPRQIADVVQAVLGFDERPCISRLRSMAESQGGNGLYPSDMARLYGIATAGRGAGQCIALIEPAGGYDPEDLKRACEAMKVPVPAVTDVSVGKGRNAFGADARADKEVSLDVQILAGVAPEARLAIYFTENNETGLADGVTEAIHDSTHRPSVIVITWGEPEISWSSAERRAARTALDAALTDAVRLGITVVAAAGDDLATDGIADNKAHVDYPASSPYVLGCGGTRITLDASGTAIFDEIVWNDGLRGTGGGISDFFLVPEFQKSAQVPPSVNDGRLGRGVPDVAAAASETNGYRIFLRGSDVTTGGTSAAAPLWAAFIALLNAMRGKSLGFINPTLYRDPDLLRRIASGDNAIFGIGYKAGTGWSACTGLGTPKGAAMIVSLTAAA